MISLHEEEEEEPNGRLKEQTRHRGPSLVGTPKAHPTGEFVVVA